MHKLLIILIFTCCLNGCVGMVVSTATSAAVAVAKVPFKVGGAVVDVVTGDEEE